MSHLQADPQIDDSYSSDSGDIVYLADDEFEQTHSPLEYHASTPNPYIGDEVMPVPEVPKPLPPLSPRPSLSPPASWSSAPTPGLPEDDSSYDSLFYDDEQDAEGSPDPEFAVETAVSEELSDFSRSMEVPQVSSSKHSSFAQASSNAFSLPNNKYHSPASPSNFDTNANTPDSNMSNTYINTLSTSPTPEATSIAQTEETKQMDNPLIALDDAYGPNQDHITASNTGETLPLIPIPDQFVPSLVDVTPTATTNYIHRGEETFDFPEDDVEECRIYNASYYYSVIYGTFVPIIPDEDM